MDIGKEKKRILVAEEDPFQRLIIREYLEIGNRFEVRETDGPYHLLSMAESGLAKLSLVLLDMEWSKVDGTELILEIRKRNSTLPILGMTDKQACYYADIRLRESNVGFIPKPFAPQHLHRSIDATLRNRHLNAIRKIRSTQNVPHRQSWLNFAG